MKFSFHVNTSFERSFPIVLISASYFFVKRSIVTDNKFAFSGKFLLTEVEYELIEDFVKNETEILNELTGLNLFDQSVKFSKPIF